MTSLPEPTVINSPTPSPTPRELEVGATRTRPADGMVMVYVPAGEFQMGLTGGSEEDLAHTVALDGFWIDRTEVSVAQFQEFVNATGYETTAEQAGKSFVLIDDEIWGEESGADWKHPEGPSSQAVNNHPVVHVSWNDAAAYCEWVGGRLLTEAEWEYAARGQERLTYPWGNTFDGTRLNFCDESCFFDLADKSVDDGYKFTAPVGSYPDGASWVGALDLAGNVWEWVADRYGSYPSGRQVNPTGPQIGRFRVVRGGSFTEGKINLRGATRMWYLPSDTFDHLGFRCGMSVAPGQ